MRGRLSIFDMVGDHPLVPGFIRPAISPSPVPHRVPKMLEMLREGVARGEHNPNGEKGRFPTNSDMHPRDTPLPMPRRGHKRHGFPRRWALDHLGDDLGDAAATAASTGGFWSTLGQGLSGALSAALPAYLQIQTGKLMATQQAQLLKVQGSQLYTPQNIQTLEQQNQFEIAQRQIEQGRAMQTTTMPISGTMLALIGGAGLVLFLVMRKK